MLLKYQIRFVSLYFLVCYTDYFLLFAYKMKKIFLTITEFGAKEESTFMAPKTFHEIFKMRFPTQKSQ